MHDKANGNELFTVILEYEGTTSAAQVRAPSADDAVHIWFESLKEEGAYGLTGAQRDKMRTAFDADESPVPIHGLGNVWCKTTLAGDRLALLHLVKTVHGSA